MRGDYILINYIENLTIYILYKNNIKSFPVSVVKICDNENITLIKNSNMHLLNKNELAKTSSIDNRLYIIYDDKLSNTEIRYAIAHELGHIFLHHKFNNTNKKDELQADTFASYLLAPTFSLQK